MNLTRRGFARRFTLAALGAALLTVLAGCYDTKLIPDDPAARGGAAGRDGNTGNAGKPASNSGSANAGAPGDDGGAPEDNGGALDAGGTPNAGGTGDRGGSTGNAGRNGEIGGLTGQAGESSTKGVTWLDLDASSAPSSSATNSALGIEGVFYAYDDGCSELEWDAATRCASGTLCDPAQSVDNWGIAVGFDFHDTGAAGTPPNTKLVWDPNDVGALGLAWRITGTAPKLQVWVLNMDPSWHGQCNVMTCEINGPPDGVAPAALNGQLLFDHLVKDDWGGTGTNYTFDPAAVHALQFKLSSLKIGAVPFDFCIDGLGIVR